MPSRSSTRLSYIAAPANDSLEAYLKEALYLIELRFQSLDEDGAGWVDF